MTSIDDKSYTDASSDDDVELMEDIVELDDNASIEETDVFEDDVVELDESSLVLPALVNPEPNLSLRRDPPSDQGGDISFPPPPPEASVVVPALLDSEPETDPEPTSLPYPTKELREQPDNPGSIEAKG